MLLPFNSHSLAAFDLENDQSQLFKQKPVEVIRNASKLILLVSQHDDNSTPLGERCARYLHHRMTEENMSRQYLAKSEALTNVLLAWLFPPNLTGCRESRYVWALFFHVQCIIGIWQFFRYNKRKHYLRITLRAFPQRLQADILAKHFPSDSFNQFADNVLKIIWDPKTRSVQNAACVYPCF